MVPGGFESAYDSFFRGLSSLFRSKGVPREEASDLAQDTLARAFVHLKRHGATSDDLWPLLRTIARNLYIERGRRPARQTVPLDEAMLVRDDASSPDELVVESERREVLRTAIVSLAPRHRRVLELALRGRGPAEIATELGIKRNAADALLHRARRNLASKLELVGSGLGAFIAPLALRARSLFRKGAETATRVDPTSAFVSMATGVAATGLAVALIGGSIVGGAAHRAGHVAVSGNAWQAHVQTRPAGTTNLHSQRMSSDKVTRVTVQNTDVMTNFGRQHVRAETKVPGSGNSDGMDVGAQFWQRDPHDPGLTGAVVGKAVTVLCAGVSQC